MTTETLDLARRAVAAVPLGGWPEGFLAINKKTGKPLGRVHKLTSGGGLIVREMPWKMVSHLYLPDLNDPATKGCLLHLVREAAEEPNLIVVWCDYEGRFVAIDGVYRGRAGEIHTSPVTLYGTGDTEIAALVAALEAGGQ